MCRNEQTMTDGDSETPVYGQFDLMVLGVLGFIGIVRFLRGPLVPPSVVWGNFWVSGAIVVLIIALGLMGTVLGLVLTKLCLADSNVSNRNVRDAILCVLMLPLAVYLLWVVGILVVLV